MKYWLVLFSLSLALPLYAADVRVAPGDPIPGDVEGTITLLAGDHTTDETVVITTSMTLTAEPGAVWNSNANPAIAVRADDVTIHNLTINQAIKQSGNQAINKPKGAASERPYLSRGLIRNRHSYNRFYLQTWVSSPRTIRNPQSAIRNRLTLRSASPTSTAIVSGSPVTLKQPSHRVTVESNTIEGYANGILHVFGDGFVARDNVVVGVEARGNTGILNTMGSDAVLEKNDISRFHRAFFLSGSHGRVSDNMIRRANFGIFLCNWGRSVPGEGSLADLVPNNSANYWIIRNNGVSEGIRLSADIWGIAVVDGANHNLIQDNIISHAMDGVGLFGSLIPGGSGLPPSYENLVIADPTQVTENLPDDPNPTFGNVLIGVKPIDERGKALQENVLLNAGPRGEAGATPVAPRSKQATTWAAIKQGR